MQHAHKVCAYIPVLKGTDVHSLTKKCQLWGNADFFQHKYISGNIRRVTQFFTPWSKERMSRSFFFFFFYQKGICFCNATIEGMYVCFIITGLKEACNETRITKMQKSEYFTEKTLWYTDLK